MIEALKKRYKIGDVITIRTVDNISFTGKINDFENTCIVLETDDCVEFIANNSVTRFSASKEINQNIAELIEKEKINNINKEIISEDIADKKSSNKQALVKPANEYKVGDIIPIDQLKKLSEKKFDSPKLQKGVKFQSLSDLDKFILPETQEVDSKIVAANGIITTCYFDRRFGFIKDKFGCELWFSFNSILDNSLLQSLNNFKIKASMPVLFTLSKNYKGDKATLIHKSKTVSEIVTMSKKYISEGKLDIALGLIQQILIAFPDDYAVKKILNEIESKHKQTQNYYSGKTTYKGYDLNYQKATKAKNIDKNYDDALMYYTLAMQNNEKRESCIKDIAMLRVAMGELKKALDFIEYHENELPKNITTYHYLANFFASVKEYNKVIKYVDLLLVERFAIKDNRKHSFYLSQKGFALIQLNKLDDAKDALEQAVSLLSENTYASRLLKALEEPNAEELSQVIEDAEFDNFGGGLSKYIKDSLENYNEYEGVLQKIIDSGSFTNENLNVIRGLIDTEGRGRPRTRAKLLLTEAKLMQLLEPEKENVLRSVLARYCNAMALIHISESSSMDVIRFFYNEAFSLEENWKSVIPQVVIYLGTYKRSYGNLISPSSASIEIEVMLSEVIGSDSKDAIWEGILVMFLWNRSISAKLITKLYRSQNYKNKSLVFLESIGMNVDKIKTIDDYTLIWNQAREKRQRDYSRWLASIKAIYSNDNIETLANQLSDSLNDSRKTWLNQIDMSRLNTISTDILDVLNQYLRQSGYRDKERCYRFAKAQVSQLILEIKEKPTKFSYEGFIPLLEKLDLLLEKSFKIVESASLPKVKISILRDASVVGDGNIVPFQVKVENSTNSSPIRDISVLIHEDSDVIFINKNDVYSDSVDGGEYCILKLSVKVSARVIIDKATTLNVTCLYKKRNQDEPVSINKELSLRLYSKEEFDIIPNPYAPIANNSGVKNKEMFYGRNEFIKNITDAILQANSKQVVIYGQKRSGKTAVLDYLKISLINTTQLFCIQFSIGDIFETISTSTFFFKILSLISEELEFLKMDGCPVPDYTCPDYIVFNNTQNPSDEFRKQIRLFNKSCQRLEQWRCKKLVILIDEFTYLYTAIKESRIPDTFMKHWKAITQNENSTFSVVLVGQDIFPAFKEEFENEFGVIQDERLTYLSEYYAEKLIEEPIWNKSANTSRLLDNALSKIIEYTSCNPYYIVQFCDRLIVEMNKQRIPAATVADVKDVADSFINGGQALTEDKFDNLFNAGEKHDIQKIPKEDSKVILRQIALNAKTIGFCLREQISIGNPEYEDEILKDLVRREVLEQKGDSYKIQVKLFHEWLLKH